MDVFKGIDLGTYASFRLMAQQNPEIAQIMHGSALAGGYLWIFFLAILAWRWWSIGGVFPFVNLAKALAIILLVEAIRIGIDRPRPDDAQDFLGQVIGQSFPNGPAFRAVFISTLMVETAKPGLNRRLGFLGAVLYCVWVMMGQLLTHLAFLTDILGGLSLALGIGLLAPHLFETQAATSRKPV